MFFYFLASSREKICQDAFFNRQKNINKFSTCRLLCNLILELLGSTSSSCTSQEFTLQSYMFEYFCIGV